MELELCLGNEVHVRPLDAQSPVHVGGGPEDEVHLPGVAPTRALVESDGGRAFVTCMEPLPIDGVLAPPHVRRLLLPDEELELAPGIRLRVASAAEPFVEGTRALAQALLGGASWGGAPLLPALTCLTGMDTGRVFALDAVPACLGRGLEADLRIRDRTVSRTHIRLSQESGGYVLEDCGTPNGTYVDNRRVQGPVRLGRRAIVEVGHTLLRWEGPADAPEDSHAVPLPLPAGAMGASSWVVAGVGGLVSLAGLVLTVGVALVRG